MNQEITKKISQHLHTLKLKHPGKTATVWVDFDTYVLGLPYVRSSVKKKP